MKVSSTHKPATYEVTMTLTAKEIKQILDVIANTGNRYLYYHPAAVEFHDALRTATGSSVAPLPRPYKPAPLKKAIWYDKDYDYGYGYGLC